MLALSEVDCISKVQMFVTSHFRTLLNSELLYIIRICKIHNFDLSLGQDLFNNMFYICITCR